MLDRINGIMRYSFQASAQIGLLALSLALTPHLACAAETGNLEALRAEALSLVNEARDESGLEPLELQKILNEAAQAHAEDMLQRNYYAHVSPEGETVKDRYRDSGGSRWKLVAENIAMCSGCSSPPSLERVRSFHEGWMGSLAHRENILTEGLDGFGFGIAGEDRNVYAVQTFAGPGMPIDLKPGEETVALQADELAQRLARLLNREREREGLAPVKASEALSQLANKLLPERSDEKLIADPGNLFGLLPQSQAGDWTTLNVLAAGCGGCGTAPTAADLRYFADQWLSNPHNRQTLLGDAASHIGLAMHANGEGRKIAIAVVGRER
jgi:uncharacterized protein YkwD